MDCILHLTATAQAHLFTLLCQDRSDRIASDVKIDVSIAIAEHDLPPCCALEIQALAFPTPTEQAAALKAFHSLVALGYAHALAEARDSLSPPSTSPSSPVKHALPG